MFLGYFPVNFFSPFIFERTPLLRSFPATLKTFQPFRLS
jgi:hypothetical protein